MRRNRQILITLAVAIFCLTMLLSGIRPAAALPAAPAVPIIPQNYLGRVSINGANVSLDTVISAWCGGVQVASTLVYEDSGETRYYLDVPGDNPGTSIKDGCTTGETVNFKIGAVPADQAGTWVEGGQNDDFHLTASVDIKIFLPLARKP